MAARKAQQTLCDECDLIAGSKGIRQHLPSEVRRAGLMLSCWGQPGMPYAERPTLPMRLVTTMIAWRIACEVDDLLNANAFGFRTLSQLPRPPTSPRS